MSRLSTMSLTTSAAVHTVVLVLLATRFAASPVQRPELAGDQLVISGEVTPLQAVQTQVTVEPVKLPKPIESVDYDRPLRRSRVPASRRTVQRSSEQQTARPDRDEVVVERKFEHFEAPNEPVEPVVVAELTPVDPAEDARRAPETEVPKEQVLTSAPVQVAGTTRTRPAQPIRNPRPVYPVDALRKRLHGLVMLRVTISETGDVLKVTVAESSGHRQLDLAARDAVANWRFLPATREGQPVEWTARMPVRFRLN